LSGVEKKFHAESMVVATVWMRSKANGFMVSGVEGAQGWGERKSLKTMKLPSRNMGRLNS
jgi:hypothetical protein